VLEKGVAADALFSLQGLVAIARQAHGRFDQIKGLGQRLLQHAPGSVRFDGSAVPHVAASLQYS